MGIAFSSPFGHALVDHRFQATGFGSAGACVAAMLILGCSGSDSPGGSANGGENGLGGATNSGGNSVVSSASGGITATISLRTRITLPRHPQGVG